MNTFTKEQLQNLIKDARKIAIVPSKIAGTDAFTAGVALYYMIKQLEKDVSIVYSGRFPEGTEELISKDDVFSNLSHRELIIEVDYSGTNADKVHYKTDNSVLQFRLGPVPKDFDRTKIIASIKSFDFDLIFVLGVQHLRDLGGIYEHMREEFDAAKIVNIDNTKRNTRFGIINVIETEIDTLSLLVFTKATEWGLTPNPKAAKSMLTGMAQSVEKLSG